MGTDARLPMEVSLPLVGLILAAYAILPDSLGVNINLVREIAVLAFGLKALLLVPRGRYLAPPNSHSSESSGL
jgi:hypothetical protein